jgi:hypothetical protein
MIRSPESFHQATLTIPNNVMNGANAKAPVSAVVLESRASIVYEDPELRSEPGLCDSAAIGMHEATTQRRIPRRSCYRSCPCKCNESQMPYPLQWSCQASSCFRNALWSVDSLGVLRRVVTKKLKYDKGFSCGDRIIVRVATCFINTLASPVKERLEIIKYLQTIG